MNMEKEVFDNGRQIIRSYDSGLFIQNEKPLKIYLEGFPISEFVELMKIVKDHGGEISSRVGAGVIVLSRPDYSVKTDSPKFDVKWLHDCISSSKILNPSKYQLKFPKINVEHEAEEKDYHPHEQNVRSQEKNNAADCHSLRKAMIKIPIVVLSPIHASPKIINGNPDPENISEIRRTPKRRRCSQQPVDTSYDSPEEKKSSKSKRYLYTTSSLLNSAIVSPPKSELSTSSIEHEADCTNVEDDMMRKSEVSPFPQTQASTDITENTLPEDTSENRIMSKSGKCSQQPVHTSCDPLEKNKPSKSKLHYYTDEEDKAMIQYVIDNDAISIAGGYKIWKKMHADQMMQHHTAKSMSHHFIEYLQKRVENFTSDGEALRKFKLRNTKRKGKKRTSDYL